MITRLELNHFTVFKKVCLDFGRKLNVLIGENGSGKTQILKFLYAALGMLPTAQNAKRSGITQSKEVSRKDESFMAVFKVDRMADLIHYGYRERLTRQAGRSDWGNCQQGQNLDAIRPDRQNAASVNAISLSSNGESYRYILSLQNDSVMVDQVMPKLPSDALPRTLFLQTRELLTIYPHYLALRREYVLPYDLTYDDTIGKLGLPYRSESTAAFESIVADLERAIDGKMFLRDEKFYFHPNSAPADEDLDINLAAEGWRKLGMLLQLLKNGGLRSGMVLCWDEPEANLNPQLIGLIANVIVQLSQLDIQVFMTTHSLFLLREIDMLTKSEKKFAHGDVRFLNFIGKGNVEQGNQPEDLGNILMLDESLAQSHRFLDMED